MEHPIDAYEGEVVRGSQRAMLLGYPTINIAHADLRVHGIYAARVVIGDSVGIAAAFADPARGVLEAHILDVSADYYGRHARIELHKRLRDNRQFESDETLKAAIASDVTAVRAYFADL